MIPDAKSSQKESRRRTILYVEDSIFTGDEADGFISTSRIPQTKYGVKYALSAT